jgi:hypothetical protein
MEIEGVTGKGGNLVNTAAFEDIHNSAGTWTATSHRRQLPDSIAGHILIEPLAIFGLQLGWRSRRLRRIYLVNSVRSSNILSIK